MLSKFKKIEFRGYFTHRLATKKNKSVEPKQSLLSQIVAYTSRPLHTYAQAGLPSDNEKNPNICLKSNL